MEPKTVTPPPTATTLRRSLGLPAVILFGLAYMAPIIVYGTFGILAEKSQGTVAMSYLLALVAVLLTAISYGRMANLYPVAGSAYSYTRRAIGAHVGFLVGWAVLLDYFFIPMVIWLIGLGPFLLIQLPITLAASSMGVWLFYVQHQFEDTYWAEDGDWSLHDAALHGSSYYDLPEPLRWMTATIGAHHVHHLSSRIPFYNLPRVLADHPELCGVSRLTLRDSFRSLRLTLWDEARQRLVSWRCSTTAQAIDRPSNVAVPRPISSNTTRERGPA